MRIELFKDNLKMDDEELTSFSDIIASMTEQDWIDLENRSSAETGMHARGAFEYNEARRCFLYTKLGRNLVRFHDDVERQLDELCSEYRTWNELFEFLDGDIDYRARHRCDDPECKIKTRLTLLYFQHMRAIALDREAVMPTKGNCDA